jgi:transcriptional regulator with XRE-family HTH domain
MSAKQLSPESAQEALTRHSGLSRNVVPLQPGRNEQEQSFPLTGSSPQADENQLSLFHPSPSPLPLKAYLACALSNVAETERQLLFKISEIVSEICKDAGIELYEPRQHTDPKLHAEASSTSVYETDTSRVLNSDLLIHLCHQPSTGAGEELEIARAALLPIILIYPDHLKVSRMILGIPSLIIQIAYKEIDDLQADLTSALFDFRPLFEERKLAFSNYKVNVVGDKVREIRQKAQLTREEVVSATSQRITLDRLRMIEENTDLESNPSLLELRELATILKTTVSEIVEPNLLQQVFIALKNWTEGREAARTFISAEDQRKIVKAMMHRMADWI